MALDMMKGWVEDLSAKNRAQEEEIKSLKLTIVTLTQELEMERMANRKTSVNVETQVEEVSRNPGSRRNVQTQSESDVNINNGQLIPRATISTGSVSQREKTRGNSEMNTSVIPIGDQFIPDNPQTQNETPYVDDSSEIDIKDEEVGYGHAKSKPDGDSTNHDSGLIDSLNLGESTQMPTKHEIDKSIQKMFRSGEKVSNTESGSDDFGMEVETNHDLTSSVGSRSPVPSPSPMTPPRSRRNTRAKRIIPSSLSTQSDSDEEPNQPPATQSEKEREGTEERPNYFYVGKVKIDIPWYKTPNDLTKELLKNKPASLIKKLKAVKVGRFYEDLDMYDDVNKTLGKLYGLAYDNKRCVLCAHLGDAIPKAKKIFHVFDRRGGYEKHWKRYHFEYTRCDICGHTFRSGLQLRAHLESQAGKPNREHAEHTRLTGEVPGLRKFGKDTPQYKAHKKNYQDLLSESDSGTEGSKTFEDEEEAVKKPKKKMRHE